MRVYSCYMRVFQERLASVSASLAHCSCSAWEITSLIWTTLRSEVTFIKRASSFNTFAGYRAAHESNTWQLMQDSRCCGSTSYSRCNARAGSCSLNTYARFSNCLCENCPGPNSRGPRALSRTSMRANVCESQSAELSQPAQRDTLSSSQAEHTTCTPTGRPAIFLAS